MKITFLDCTKTPYDGHTQQTKPLGGIEGTTVALAEAFAAKGYDVCVVNQNTSNKPQRINDVLWCSYNNFDFNDPQNFPDILIANNNAPLLESFPKSANSKIQHYILWLHNPVKLMKTIKKKRMGALLRKKPIAVFLGEKQSSTCSKLHPFQKRVIIPHGLPESFFSVESTRQAGRKKQAIFFSQPYRGFKEIVDLWCQYIHPQMPDAQLKAYVGDIKLSDFKIMHAREELERLGIHIMSKVEKSVLIEDLKQSRCMLYLGHEDETFCVAATEANALGVPIVTYGRGSLSERVIDQYNGYLVKDGDAKDAAQKVCALFQDDALFQTLSENAIQHVQNLHWDKIAEMWEDQVFNK